jgi:hypothetical protein
MPSAPPLGPALEQVLRAETTRPAAPEVLALVAAVRARFGDAVRGVLFYGSCRRGVGLRDGIVDFWVLVDDRRRCEKPWAARLGGWLPPNVYYLETDWLETGGHEAGRHEPNGPAGGGEQTGAGHPPADAPVRLRAKVALFTLPELERGATALETYVWGRLAQPVSIVFAATAADERALLGVLARCVGTFLDDALALAPGGDALAVWREGLGRSYGTELRAEGAGRANDVVGNDAAHYVALTAAARPEALAAGADGVLRALPVPGADARALLRRWRRRARAGKVRSLLRLLKGLQTFEGGFDYIAWKLSRHAGREVVIPERVRRWPLIFLWGLMWKLYREGVFR